MINGARKIISELNKNGFSGYMVGGCVRDSLMGITPRDYDITSDALPEDIISIFDKTYLTGKNTVRLPFYHQDITMRLLPSE